MRKLQNKMALLCCETLVRGRSCCLRKESHGSENKHCEAFFPPSGEHSVGAMWSAVHLPSFPRCALFCGVRRFVAKMIFVDPIRRRVFLGFAVGVDWVDFLDGTICLSFGEKTTMHTVFENGNFDEVWFGSVNLSQNANVGIGSLLCVCQCAFWSDFGTVQNDVRWWVSEGEKLSYLASAKKRAPLSQHTHAPTSAPTHARARTHTHTHTHTHISWHPSGEAWRPKHAQAWAVTQWRM